MIGIDSALNLANSILNKIWPPSADPNEKLKAASIIEAELNKRDNLIIDAQKEIIVAEMNQGDNYTKRARPSVVYFGLIFIGLVHVLFPIVIKIVLAFRFGNLSSMQIAELSNLLKLTLPAEFWLAWGSVVSIWEIGRSAEKRGANNKVIDMITGRK